MKIALSFLIFFAWLLLSGLCFGLMSIEEKPAPWQYATAIGMAGIISTLAIAGLVSTWKSKK